MQISHEPFRERTTDATELPRPVAQLPRWITLVTLSGLLVILTSADLGMLAMITAVALVVTAISLGPILFVGLVLTLWDRFDRPTGSSRPARSRVRPPGAVAPSDADLV